MPTRTRSGESSQARIGFRTRKPRSCTVKSSISEGSCEQILCKKSSDELALGRPVESKDISSENANLCARNSSPRKRLFDNQVNLSSFDKENRAEEEVPSPTKQKRIDRPSENACAKAKETPVSRLTLNKQDALEYGKLRQNLHTSIPDRLLCREKESSIIFKFLSMHIRDELPGSLYISGAPGTGKTVCLTKAIDIIKVKSSKKFKTVWLNCMSLKQSGNVYYKIACEVSSKDVKCKDSEKFLEKFFIASNQMMVLVLDEIDQLESKNQEILYKIFEWASHKESKLILIGIANALDLTDRVLPRLQTKTRCQPDLLQFVPYTKNQIAEILDDRLKEVNTGLVDDSTVQFCARKVAAVAGDMRKALDIMRRSVEIVEIETKKQQILKVVTNSPQKEERPSPSISKKKVTLTHVAKVVSEVYGTGLTAGKGSCKESLPLQQKVLICTLLLLLKKEKAKQITLAKLHRVYCLICKERQLASIHQEEFVSLCQLVESRGIISMKLGKDTTRMAKVCLRLQESDVEHALQDKILLSSILDGGIPT
eukprot:gene17515-19265_t